MTKVTEQIGRFQQFKLPIQIRNYNFFGSTQEIHYATPAVSNVTLARTLEYRLIKRRHTSPSPTHVW